MILFSIYISFLFINKMLPEKKIRWVLLSYILIFERNYDRLLIIVEYYYSRMTNCEYIFGKGFHYSDREGYFDAHGWLIPEAWENQERILDKKIARASLRWEEHIVKKQLKNDEQIQREQTKIAHEWLGEDLPGFPGVRVIEVPWIRVTANKALMEPNSLMMRRIFGDGNVSPRGIPERLILTTKKRKLTTIPLVEIQTIGETSWLSAWDVRNIRRIMYAISERESHHNYAARWVSITQKIGWELKTVHARWRYQIMSYNWEKWCWDYGLDSANFSPNNQDEVAFRKMSEYYKKHRDAQLPLHKIVREMALDWYGRGKPSIGPMPSVYADRVMLATNMEEGESDPNKGEKS